MSSRLFRCLFFFSKQKTAYEMRISDWSSDVCSSDLIDGEGLDAVVINASGCGTTVKDYGYMFRADSDWAGKAARVSALARDVAEFMSEIGLGVPIEKPGLAVAYHAACSLQPGQQQIGRASCRAREWPYVEISVVAVSLKKKK